MITASDNVQNLGVALENQLSFSAHVASLNLSYMFLTEATQLLVQSIVISRLEYCNLPLAHLPMSNITITTKQQTQNAASVVEELGD